jgi:Peptidase_C39 like family
MSLEIPDGIPIIPKPAVVVPAATILEAESHTIQEMAIGDDAEVLADVVVAEHVVMTLAQHAPPDSPHHLKIEPEPQLEIEWCWAACVQMVLAYQRVLNQTDQPVKQCEIVTKMLKLMQLDGSKCCEQPDDYRLAGCDAQLVSRIWDAYGIKSQLIIGRLSMDAIKAEIDQHQRPVEVGLHWSPAYGDNGHAVIIKGWVDDGTDTLWVNDPIASSLLWASDDEANSADDSPIGGEGKITYEELAGAFGHGAWVCSWSGLEPD